MSVDRPFDFMMSSVDGTSFFKILTIGIGDHSPGLSCGNRQPLGMQSDAPLQRSGEKVIVTICARRRPGGEQARRCGRKKDLPWK